MRWKQFLKNVVDTIKKDGHKILFVTQYGSYLYGTNTSSSDFDFKGVFLPSWKSVILGKAPKHYTYSTKKKNEVKNSKNDCDIQLLSLQHFLGKISKGEINAVDILFAPTNQDAVIYINPVYKEQIFNRRKQFVSKDITAYLGYINNQASKYGMKGTRLGVVKELVNILDTKIIPVYADKLNTLRLGDIKQELFKYLPPNNYWQPINGNSIVGGGWVLDKQYQDHLKIKLFYESLQNYYKKYGKRAELAEQNQGVDWKALSHALRSTFQVKKLLLHGEFTFPFRGKERELLLNIKQGRLSFKEVEKIIESEKKEIEKFKEHSSLPQKIDSALIEQILLDFYRAEVVEQFVNSQHLSSTSNISNIEPTL